MPAFTSDFDSFVYFFIDLFNAVDMGVVSDGEFTVMMVEIVFTKPIMSTEKGKRKVIKEFKNAIYTKCLAI